MGYTHYWTQKRAFTDAEWKLVLGETERIIAKAAHGHYYSGNEDSTSQDNVTVDEQGFRHEFAEPGAWRTFPTPDAPIPCQGKSILIAGPTGRGKPRLSKYLIALNGKQPEEYESFILGRQPPTLLRERQNPDAMTGFCKTEYRPYDAVVVSILAVAQKVAPDAIVVTSDGGAEAIRYLF